ncbi:MAG: bifunctional riboflavin kinase/FAD synthetase [Chitinophagaceae bacterium]|jgi:riboflavin kinase/FMN adenylyltransferase|nr:bifunctional riboflavin kinase/FAD synthetase [Chitinophagaceae bacterium]
MQVHYNINHLPKFQNAIVTIGTFDGVHIGHRQIIAQLKQEAENTGGETVIVTFHPHPRAVVNEGKKAVPVLTTLTEKIFLLEKYGIEHLIVIPFDELFSNQTAEEYIQDFLYAKLHPCMVIIGFDHRFGKGRTGNYRLLEEKGNALGFEVKEISEQLLNEIKISSTNIREALLHKELDQANALLGYHYFFEGIVVNGNRLGRELGYPTANIEVQDSGKLIPADGIYVVEILLENERLQGMMSIGFRPVVGGTHRTIEVNIFNFNKDIYGQTLKIIMRKFIRDEQNFSGLPALVEQLAIDKKTSLEFFKNN